MTAILTPGEDPTVDAGQAVLWLDDLEPFLNSGVTLRTLNEWNAVADGRVVAIEVKATASPDRRDFREITEIAKKRIKEDLDLDALSS